MPLRTGIIGYGRTAAQLHAPALEAHGEAFRVVAVCDPSPKRQMEAKERFGCAVGDDYRTMLRDKQPDLILVLTRNDQHAAMAEQCLETGAHVLVTKPWAINLKEAEHLHRAAATAKGKLIPFLPARWGVDYRRLRELLAENAIGNVFMIRRAASSFATRDDWQTLKKFGGGYILNWGPHLVDPACLLAGGKPASLYARTGRAVMGGDCEDHFLAVITMDNGTVVQVGFGVTVESLPSWFIQGDRGTIVVRDNCMKIYQQAPAHPTDPTQQNDMKAQDEAVIEETLEGELFGDTTEVYGEIAQALSGRTTFPTTPDDALLLSRLLDGIRTSGEENRVMHFGE